MAMTLNAEFGGNVKVNKMYVNKNGKSMIEQARFISRTLGVQCAAKYLKNRGWSIESVLWILAGSTREPENRRV